MSNPNQISMTFPTAVKFQGAYEFSGNKAYNEMTTADIKIYQPTLSVYLLKQAGVLEDTNVLATVNVNVNESVTLDVNETIAKDSIFNALVLAKNLEQIKDHIEKELVRLHADIEDKRNAKI